MAVAAGGRLIALDYEVFGRVQGVFFRKFTKGQATKLGLCGWVMNTDKGTVKGQLEGEKEKVEMMKTWLRNTGSPSSRIDRAVFSNETEIQQFTFQNFSVRSQY